MNRRLGLLALVYFGLATLANGETSSDLLRTNIKGQYQLMKQSFAELYSHAPPWKGTPDPKTTYDLVDCVNAQPMVWIQRNRLATAVAILSAEVTVASDRLKWLGYPSSTWERWLATYESDQLKNISVKKEYDVSITDKMIAQLTADLDRYRTSVAQQLPKVEWETACGGAGMPVRVTTAPRRGKVYLMPELFHIFCTAQGVKPDDFIQCNQWDEVSDDEEALVTGVYWYRAVWRNHSPVQGRKDFTHVREGATWHITSGAN